MAQIEEFSFLLEMDESGILKISDDAGAMQERINEWLATPQGTVADMPGWGHQLSRLKFEPPSPDLSVMAEMLIAEKLSLDVKDMVLRGVLVEFDAIDLMRVTVDYGYGIVTIEMDNSYKFVASKVPSSEYKGLTFGGESVTFGGEAAQWQGY